MDPHDDVDDILRANRSREKHYVFDNIFSMEATQEDVYYAAIQEKGIIESVLSGYNCTVFAYGATGERKWDWIPSESSLGIQDTANSYIHSAQSFPWKFIVLMYVHVSKLIVLDQWF